MAIIEVGMTEAHIRNRAGGMRFQRGLQYHRERRVLSFQQDKDQPSLWRARVRGRIVYDVTITQSQNAAVVANCTCLAFIPGEWCKHIVAVSLLMLNRTDSIEAPGVGDALVPSVPEADELRRRHAEEVLGLFRSLPVTARPAFTQPQAERVPVGMEFVLAAQEGPGWLRGQVSLEMRVGIERLYIVTKMAEFVDAIERGQPYTFSKRFTFDPREMEFSEEAKDVLAQVRQILQQSAYYRSGSGYYGSPTVGRSVVIPPFVWPDLWPRLAQARTTILHHGKGYRPFVMEEPGRLLTISINRHGAEYTLTIHGLEDVRLFTDYGFVQVAMRTVRMDSAHLQALRGLRRWVRPDGSLDLSLDPQALEESLTQVLPRLNEISEVRVARSIMDRIVTAPLAVRYYLDYAGGQLNAKLHFTYGDLVITANEPVSQRADERIVQRDLEGELQARSLLERAHFGQDDAGDWVLTDEAEQYHFLFHQLTVLQETGDLYVTEAVQGLLGSTRLRPRTRLELRDGENWLEVAFDVSGLDPEEIRRVLQSVSERRRYHRLGNGAFVPLDGREWQAMGQILDDLKIDPERNDSGTWRLPAYRALPLLDQRDDEESVRLGRSLRLWLNNLKHPDYLDFPVPTSMGAVLRDYQGFGFQWMKTLAHYGFGGILADDMGLGKTIQAISFLVSEKETTRERHPALIVCPASLMYNWESEIHRFAPALRVATVGGLRSERVAQLAHMDTVDVLITSYPLIHRDVDLYSNRLFSTLILDEAQAIKNDNTKTGRAVYRVQSTHRFALTGTPVENALSDVWALFRAVFPALVGDKREFTSLPPADVVRRIRPFLLRRLKADVLQELPEKIESEVKSELSGEQKKLYLAYLARMREDTARELNITTFQKSRIKILAGLTRLRQICCHPGLVVEDFLGESAKLEQLMEILHEAVESGRRILLYSQFTSMLAIIRERLNAEKLDYYYLDGETPVAERLTLCNAFNAGTRPVFLLSLKAGGVGLNLTGADMVILYDLWWNPAVEEQAVDRAHRIGQKKVVQVVRMISRGTIEEKMYQLQQKKRDLIDQIVQSNSEGLTALTEDDVRELLAL